MNTVHMMSQVMWHGVINCGSDTLCIVSDVKHIMVQCDIHKGVISWKEWVGDTGTVAVMVQI